MSSNCSCICVLYGLSKWWRLCRKDWHQVHPCCLQSHEKDFEFLGKNEELLVLPSVVEETEKSVQIHVGRTFQKVLLQRVLEIVDSFIRILQLVDCLVDNPVSGLQWLFCPHARMVVIMQKGP